MKLVLETSNRQASMLLETHQGTYDLQMSEDQRQSSHLLPMVETLLAQQQLKASQIESFYVHTGPGSSTGLRMGVAMAQGWAAVYPKVRFYEVHLEAMALEVLNNWMPDKQHAYLLADAFAGQVFIQSFVKKTNGFQFEGSLQLKSRSVLEELNPDAAIVDDLGFLKKKQTWPQTWIWYEGVFPHAIWVHRAGSEITTPSDIHNMDVRYLKATSAELKWQEKESK